MNSISSIRSFPAPLIGRYGFTYVELMITLAIASLIIVGLGGVVGQALQSQDAVSETNKLTRDARFAMQRMLATVSGSRRLLLPLKDNPNTNWPEHVREQTVPASPPVGDSTLATAVLAVTLPAGSDLDNDGVADADNDGDGLIDEDTPSDASNDGVAGIIGIDDDGDGTADVSAASNPDRDDDEDGDDSEDSLDGIDNDGDDSIDEDMKADNNDDGASGIIGVDDNANLSIDEGDQKDDDEDGSNNEDWFDPVVYFLAGNSLIERVAVPWDTNADSVVTGRDFIESVIAENVTRFRVERLANGSEVEVIELTLELSSPLTGETVSLQVQARVGGSL